MPQDYSWLAQGSAPVQLPNPIQQFGQMLTLSELARRNRQGQEDEQAKVLDRQASVLAAQAMGEAQQTGDYKGAIQRLAQQGDAGAYAARKLLDIWRTDQGTQAELDVKRSTANKNNADAYKINFEARAKGLNDIANVAAGQARAGQVDTGMLESMAQFYGVPLPQRPQGMSDQQYAASIAASAVSEKDRMANDTALRGQDVTMRGQDIIANTAANEQAVQRRGQDMTAGTAAARLAFDKTQGDKPSIQVGTDGQIYAVDARNATGRPVIGPDNLPLNKGEKPLTEVQGNATAFGMRMKAANDVINGLSDQGYDLSSPSNLLAENGVTNYGASKEAQAAYQAKLNFMTASLRKESGAAISKSEFESEDKKYFPQPGDKPDTIAQKKTMRDLAIRAMATQAGPGAKQIGSVSTGKGVSVTAPNGKTYTFPDEASAAEFKAKAGLL